MSRIKIMINGLPGNVARMLSAHVMTDDRFALIPCSLTGPEITTGEHIVSNTPIRLIRPDQADAVLAEIKRSEGDFICIDYTHPSAVNDNARLYCRQGLFFVMGTTGGDRKALGATVESSAISAVIAPNMAKQIVGFQAMMAYAAQEFPGLFSGYTLEIEESHQRQKADTSGTARAMAGYFNTLGIDFSEDDIVKIRDPEIQKTKLGVPAAYIDGHGWHTYTLTSPDGTVLFRFTHNINGRDVYSQGTLDAVAFLHEKARAKVAGRIYSMIDVLKGK